MKSSVLLVLALLLVLAGCSDKEPTAGPPRNWSMPPADMEKRIKAAMAKLPAEDQPLAAAQEYCPMMEKVRLGETGPPTKITIEGKTVFVCCGGCVKRAKENPEETLATLESMKEKSKAARK